MTTPDQIKAEIAAHPRRELIEALAETMCNCDGGKVVTRGDTP